MTKKLLFTILGYSFVYGQVGINTINPKATLDVTSNVSTGTNTTAEGVLVPRVDRQRAQSMNSVAESTLIYINSIVTGSQSGSASDIDTVGYYYYNGTKWTKLNTGSVKNIYNSDDALTGDRVVTQGDKKLAFKGTVVNSFSVNDDTFSVDAINQRVGIGLTNPTSKLEIFDPIEKGYVFKARTNNGNTVIYHGDSNTFDGIGSWIGNTTRQNLYLMVNNIGALQINPTTGVIKPMNAYTIVTSSDRRLKKDVQQIVIDNKNVKGINGLLPVQYKMISNKEGRLEFGFIAQDLEKVYPNLVFTDEKGWKSVNYTGLIPVLVAELKKEQSEIEELKKMVKSLIEDKNAKN